MAEEETKSHKEKRDKGKHKIKKSTWYIAGGTLAGVGIIWFLFLKPKSSSSSGTSGATAIPSGATTPSYSGTGYAGSSSYPSGSSIFSTGGSYPSSGTTSSGYPVAESYPAPSSSGTTSSGTTSSGTTSSGSNATTLSPSGTVPSGTTSSYNTYINELKKGGTIPTTIAQKTGVAYENLGVDPFNTSRYIFGAYRNGAFTNTYTQLKSKTGASAQKTGAIV